MKVPMPMAPPEVTLPADDAYSRCWLIERLFSGKDCPEAAEAGRERDIIPRAARRTVGDLDPRCGDCSHLSRNDGPCPGGSVGRAAIRRGGQADDDGPPLCHDRLDAWRERLWAREDAA